MEYAAGTRDLQRMGGLARKMPFTGATSFIASMSIAGVPPFNGFWSKLIIIVAAVEAGRLGYAFWAVLASLLTLASFMKVMKYGFFGSLREKLSHVREVPFFMKLSMALLAFICLAGGALLLPNIDKAFLGRASQALVDGTQYSTVVLGGIK